MTEHDLILAARRYAQLTSLAMAQKLLDDLADALESANTRANRLEKALRPLRDLLAECEARDANETHSNNAYEWFAKKLRAALAGVPAEPATEEKPTEGLPSELARILRDPTITIQRDHEIRLADGRTLFEHMEEWRNAPSNTASAHIEPPVEERGSLTPAEAEYVAHLDAALAASSVSAGAKVLADDEVCACLDETGERRVRLYERCERCGSFMAGAGQVPADTIKRALRLAAIGSRGIGVCVGCHRVIGSDDDHREGCVVYGALAAVGAQEETKT